MHDGHWPGYSAGSFSDKKKGNQKTDQDPFQDWGKALILLIKVEAGRRAILWNKENVEYLENKYEAKKKSLKGQSQRSPEK